LPNCKDCTWFNVNEGRHCGVVGDNTDKCFHPRDGIKLLKTCDSCHFEWIKEYRHPCNECDDNFSKWTKPKIKITEAFSYGWLLSDGTIIPFTLEDGKLIRWKKTEAYKQGLKLKDLSQGFYVAKLLFGEMER